MTGFGSGSTVVAVVTDGGEGDPLPSMSGLSLSSRARLDEGSAAGSRYDSKASMP